VKKENYSLHTDSWACQSARRPSLQSLIEWAKSDLYSSNFAHLAIMPTSNQQDAEQVDYGASSYASRLTPRTEKGGGLSPAMFSYSPPLSTPFSEVVNHA